MAKRTPPDNPYLAARLEWNERYGSYVRSASYWRSVGLLSMTMAVIGFGYALYQSTQVKLVPYIVEVDKLGNAVSGGFPAQIEYADPRHWCVNKKSMISVYWAEIETSLI